MLREQLQKKRILASLEKFSNTCHDPATGRFCDVPGHPKPKPEIRKVAISDLTPTQWGFKEDVIQKYIKATKHNRPKVVESAGKLWVDDGHHRILAAKQQGETHIEVNVHKYDPAKHRPAQGIDYSKPETAKITWDIMKKIPSYTDQLNKMIAELKAPRKPKLAGEDLEEFYNKCHSPETGKFCDNPSHDHSDLCSNCPDDEKTLVRNLDPSIKPIIAEMLTDRREVEPEYTGLFSDISKDQGGEMIGLDFKFKDATGVVSKVDRKVQKKGLPPEEAAKDIVDSLRYTMSFPPENYTEGVKSTIKALADKGIEFDSMDNNWERGDAYNGINAVFIDTNTGLKIELQFHTPESFTVKDKLNHEDYVFNREGRGTSTQRLVRHERMRQRSDAITFPTNVEQLSGNISGIKVNDIFRPNTDTLLTIERSHLLRF